MKLVALREVADPEANYESKWATLSFAVGEGAVRAAMDQGVAPWWTGLDLRLAFFRPLAGATHGIGFRLWPERPWLMHLHSLRWFGARVAVAALLYRRLMEPAWVAGLADMVFALDDAHGSPAAWLANRIALLGSLFGLLALLFHDRWRREGWRPVAPRAESHAMESVA